MYVDATRDNKIVSDLEDTGLDVHAVNFGSEKTTLVQNLITAVEAGELTLPNIDPLVHELEVYEAATTASGNTRYAAPDGFKDDCVDALALAWKGSDGDGISTARVRLSGDMTDLTGGGSARKRRKLQDSPLGEALLDARDRRRRGGRR